MILSDIMLTILRPSDHPFASWLGRVRRPKHGSASISSAIGNNVMFDSERPGDAAALPERFAVKGAARMLPVRQRDPR
jgi:hypothetical protein